MTIVRISLSAVLLATLAATVTAFPADQDWTSDTAQPGTAAAASRVQHHVETMIKPPADSFKCLAPHAALGATMFDVTPKLDYTLQSNKDVKDLLGNNGIDFLAVLRAKCGGDNNVTNWKFDQYPAGSWTSSFNVPPNEPERPKGTGYTNPCVGDALELFFGKGNRGGC